MIGPAALVDPVAIMGAVLAELDGEGAGAGTELGAKDRAGLLGTTALKTLVVLLAPPPAPKGGGAATRWGMVAVVVHAKEPKTAAVANCLASFVQRLVVAAQAAATALSAADASVAAEAPLRVVVRVRGADFTNFAILSDTNIAKPKLNKGYLPIFMWRCVWCPPHWAVACATLLYLQYQTTLSLTTTPLTPIYLVDLRH